MHWLNFKWHDGPRQKKSKWQTSFASTPVFCIKSTHILTFTKKLSVSRVFKIVSIKKTKLNHRTFFLRFKGYYLILHASNVVLWVKDHFSGSQCGRSRSKLPRDYTRKRWDALIGPVRWIATLLVRANKATCWHNAWIPYCQLYTVCKPLTLCRFFLLSNFLYLFHKVWNAVSSLHFEHDTLKLLYFSPRFTYKKKTWII